MEKDLDGIVWALAGLGAPKAPPSHKTTQAKYVEIFVFG